MEHVVKSIQSRGFEIALVEVPDGWKVTYDSPERRGESEVVEQLSVAMYLFDEKLRDLNGH